MTKKKPVIECLETPAPEPAKPSLKKYYPSWCCNDCGFKASDGRKNMVSSYHFGFCDVCGDWKPLTEPRDFYYPLFNIKAKAPENRKG